MKHVPELSLADLDDPGKAEAFGRDLHAGLRHYGFIILRDHGVPDALLERAYGASRAFFARGEAEKDALSNDAVMGQRGYVAFGREHAKGNTHPDLKEMYHIGRPKTDQPPGAHYPDNIWPDEPAEFRKTFTELYAALDAAGHRVLAALEPQLELEPGYFDRLASGGNSLLRLLHYPPLAPGRDPNSVRAAAHEDINLLTLLVAASSSGLELLDRDGSWLAVEGSRNAIIVDAGDMLARITAGRIPATTHRVVNPSGPNVARYSMPFFIHPKSDAVLSVIESCRDGEVEPDIVAGDFLRQRLEDIGMGT